MSRGTYSPFSDVMKTLHGIPLTVSEYAMVRRWVFPKWLWWTPTKDTERWCRFFDFGHEVSEPGCYMVGGTLVVHPIIAEALRHAIT